MPEKDKTSQPQIDSAAARTAGPPASQSRTAASPTRPRILVIDDSEVMLTRIRRALEAAGYEAITTARAVGNARYIPTCDLVIIDYHMPGIDGATVLASLRAASKGLKDDGRPECLFYLYTSDVPLVKDFGPLGFDGSLTDKGDEEALVRQVRAVFRMRQMRALKKKTTHPST